MPCVTNLWRKLVQQSKCVLTAKVLQAVAGASLCAFVRKSSKHNFATIFMCYILTY